MVLYDYFIVVVFRRIYASDLASLQYIATMQEQRQTAALHGTVKRCLIVYMMIVIQATRRCLSYFWFSLTSTSPNTKLPWEMASPLIFKIHCNSLFWLSDDQSPALPIIIGEHRQDASAYIHKRNLYHGRRTETSLKVSGSSRVKTSGGQCWILSVSRVGGSKVQ